MLTKLYINCSRCGVCHNLRYPYTEDRLAVCGSVEQRAPSGNPDSSGDDCGGSAQMDFVVSHYWDNFDFADTAWIADTMVLGQTFGRWASLLIQMPQTWCSCHEKINE